ncbi:MAG TPA: cysteine desulfurase-like protein [Pyrinomonadaceae bacterium]|jgi:cysteine desulfurase family protein (TIGR01976 family)|nr:cysteine desulfurase-like protein [Pyrinomonadaceae bacterium]
MTERAQRQRRSPEIEAVQTVEAIRAHFPALERSHQGHAVAYFDGPGGTQVPRAVVEAIADYLYQHNANTHWAYPASAETDALIDGARQTLADFLNASPTEIAFGANMTTLAFHLSRALGRQLTEGDEIVVTELDHHANVAPWHALAVERGLRLRMAKMLPETGQLDWDDFSRLVNERTKLVAVGAASNALGTITDVRRAAEAAHAVGALCFVDAVHFAPHQLVDVRALDCDFLACSAYKFCGPHIGVLYGKRELFGSLDFPKLLPAPDTAPERVETGTQNHEGIAGAAAAVDFFASLATVPAANATRRERLRAAFAALHARGADLTTRLWQGLSETKGVRLYGVPPGAPRTPTVAFTVEGVASTSVAQQLAARGLFLSHGDFYAATVVERLGLGVEGLVRAGCACYTTQEEIDRLIQGVGEIARRA